MEKKFLNSKPTIKMLNSNEFSDTESWEVSLNGNVYNISVDYNSIDKSDIKHSQVFND